MKKERNETLAHKRVGGERVVQFSRLIPAELMTTAHKLIDLMPDEYDSLRGFVINAIDEQIETDIAWLAQTEHVIVTREKE